MLIRIYFFLKKTRYTPKYCNEYNCNMYIYIFAETDTAPAHKQYNYILVNKKGYKKYRVKYSMPSGGSDKRN